MSYLQAKEKAKEQFARVKSGNVPYIKEKELLKLANNDSALVTRWALLEGLKPVLVMQCGAIYIQ